MAARWSGGNPQQAHGGVVREPAHQLGVLASQRDALHAQRQLRAGRDVAAAPKSASRRAAIANSHADAGAPPGRKLRRAVRAEAKVSAVRSRRAPDPGCGGRSSRAWRARGGRRSGRTPPGRPRSGGRRPMGGGGGHAWLPQHGLSRSGHRPCDTTSCVTTRAGPARSMGVPHSPGGPHAVPSPDPARPGPGARRRERHARRRRAERRRPPRARAGALLHELRARRNTRSA